MTKLQLTATILAGICASPARSLNVHPTDLPNNVSLAIQYASELIKQLDEEWLRERIANPYEPIEHTPLP